MALESDACGQSELTGTVPVHRSIDLSSFSLWSTKTGATERERERGWVSVPMTGGTHKVRCRLSIGQGDVAWGERPRSVLIPLLARSRERQRESVRGRGKGERREQGRESERNSCAPASVRWDGAERERG